MKKFRLGSITGRRKLLIGTLIAAVAVGIFVAIANNTGDKTASPSPSHSTSKSAGQTGKGGLIVHEDITATVFWVGEPASADNDYIQNISSAWQDDWMSHYGGFDDPDNRCGNYPCTFTPKENPFYFALPFNDYQENGKPKPVSVLSRIPWYTAGQPTPGTSLIKNSWVEIKSGDKIAYAQQEDVGPFGENDVNYVFGTARPQEHRAGIDLSPALADTMGFGGSEGRGTVSWRFVDESQVPDGPWKQIITTSSLDFK